MSLRTIVLLGLTAASTANLMGCTFGCGSNNRDVVASDTTTADGGVTAVRSLDGCEALPDGGLATKSSLILNTEDNGSAGALAYSITLTVTGDVQTATPIPLIVPLPDGGLVPEEQTVTSSDGNVAFSFVRSSDAPMVAEAALQSVVVTLGPLPDAGGGGVFTGSVDAIFVDGWELEKSFEANVRTDGTPCTTVNP